MGINRTVSTSLGRRAFGAGPAVVAVLAVSMWSAACGGRVEGSNDSGSAQSTAKRAISELQQARIYFAHQSVGGNIIDGIQHLQQGFGERLNVVEGDAALTATGGVLAHARLGENGDPKGKTDAFVSTLESGGLGERVDVALQKYCFADFGSSTDPNDVFAYYQQGMDRLHREFPHLVIAHVTAPLVVVQSGPKALAKRILGRTPDHYDDNLTRERFNELLRKTYGGREPLFDLAALESSRPGQPREGWAFGDATVYQLLPEYSSDGAHLNEGAEARIGAELLSWLADVVARHDVRAERGSAGRR